VPSRRRLSHQAVPALKLKKGKERKRSASTSIEERERKDMGLERKNLIFDEVEPRRSAEASKRGGAPRGRRGKRILFFKSGLMLEAREGTRKICPRRGEDSCFREESAGGGRRLRRNCWEKKSDDL